MSIKLNNGTEIPIVGFGAGTALFGRESAAIIKSALATGYRYFDAAQMYGNSESIGAALEETATKREDVYLLTKFGQDGATEIDPRKILQDELKRLRTDHVDLYLIHNPFYTGGRTLPEVWRIMEQLVDEGLTKSIGVSNFREEDLLELESSWRIKPAVNQIEFHPYVFHPANMVRLLEFQRKHDIKVESYGPQTPLFRVQGPVTAVAEDIAKAHNLTPGQVLLLWAQQYTQGVVVTTSRNESRQKEQLAAFNSTLNADEVERISRAGREKYYRHFMHVVWDGAKE